MFLGDSHAKDSRAADSLPAAERDRSKLLVAKDSSGEDSFTAVEGDRSKLLVTIEKLQAEVNDTQNIGITDFQQVSYHNYIISMTRSPA